MPRKKIIPTMNWNDAPDTVDPEIVSKILGCSKKTAEKYFNEDDFPILDKIGLRADKEAARMYFQGFRVKKNQKLCVEQMILIELQKINKRKEVQVNERTY